MATVVLNDEAFLEVETLPLPVQKRMWNIIARLENWPAVSGAKALGGGLAGCYRVRTGDYRLIFRATDRTATATLTVVRMGHRKDVYDD